MRLVVPGGFYSHDSALKKIWLDYSYYGLGVENVESVRNLTRNSIIYSVKRSIPGITFSNGCITYSRDCYSEDLDKLQIVLRTPVPDSLELLEATEGVITLETDGEVLVLPTENAAVLPSYNEYVANTNRLTIAESPFGGLKGSGSPDYAVGTVSTNSDNIYIRDIAGNNESKVLPAGKLKELGYLTVDTSLHTVTEEFSVVNTSEVESVAVINIRCPNYIRQKTLSLFISSAYVAQTVVFTDVVQTTGTQNSFSFSRTLAAGSSERWKCVILYDDFNLTVVPDLSGNGNNGTIVGGVTKLTEGGLTFDGSSGTVSVQNSGGISIGLTDFMLSMQIKTVNTISQRLCMKIVTSPSLTGLNFMVTGAGYLSAYLAQGGTVRTTTASSRRVNDGTVHDIELFVDRSLNKLRFFVDGEETTYAAQASISDINPTNTGNVIIGRTQNGTEYFSGTLYSVNYDGKIVFLPTVSNMGSTTHQFEDSTNTSYGLQNLTLPWIALYDPATSLIEFYLHTNRPTALSFKRDENGTIHELSLYPGSGSIYHGQITFADLSLDSDSDLIPNCLEASVNGSITQFLRNYGMVI